MDPRFACAKAVGAVSTWALKSLFRRPAANFPGKIGLYVDPQLIFHLKSRLSEGSVMVVGTNGKTTVTNLLADAFEAAGWNVTCNRTGANLDSGIATALLHTQAADWGVFESDELWLAQVLPQLQPRFVVLLNLFRDQLDRMGEIDHIQASIADALASSPSTTLVYNADDPLCQAIANRVENRCISFGIDENLGLEQNTVADASMCQECDSILDYAWRQYGQLGAFRCLACGFQRVNPDFKACGISFADGRAAFSVRHASRETRIDIPFSGAYMLYNALAMCTAAECCGISSPYIDAALQTFAPQNGRLQRYEIGGQHVLLNLAKNPTGFNQNLRIVESVPGPKAVAFFINDREADGHDISWLWDIDFQELAKLDDLVAYAGGIRRCDMQVRLKYAGIEAGLVDGADDFLAQAYAASPDASLFLIANYTALPEVKAKLDHLQQHASASCSMQARQVADTASGGPTPEGSWTHPEKITILHLFPELLNLYGDGGNVIVLAERARKRGIAVDIVRVGHGQKADFSRADIVFLGGGPDREQRLASLDLAEQAEGIREYVENDGVLLAICGGYQILGHEWLLGDETVPGLGIVDITTRRAEGGSHNRLVGNIALHSPLASMPVIGYENHAGRTFLGSGCEPFGRVIGTQGKGNNDVDKADGVRYRNVVGSYLHGPLLAKNPQVADYLIQSALVRRARIAGQPAPSLPPLDDSVEEAANEFMRSQLGL